MKLFLCNYCREKKELKEFGLIAEDQEPYCCEECAKQKIKSMVFNRLSLVQ